MKVEVVVIVELLPLVTEISWPKNLSVLGYGL